MERIRKHSDAIIGIIFLVFCAFMILATLRIRNTQSRIMPFLAIGMIALPAAFLVVRSVVFKHSPNARLAFKRREVAIWLMFVGMVALMRWVGFYPAAFVFVFVLVLFQVREFDTKSMLKALIYSSVLTLSIYLVFTLGVKMALPTGMVF